MSFIVVIGHGDHQRPQKAQSHHCEKQIDIWFHCQRENPSQYKGYQDLLPKHHHWFNEQFFQYKFDSVKHINLLKFTNYSTSRPQSQAPE